MSAARALAATWDVFLDADPAPARIRSEFERLKRLARAHGSALAIGHPYATTLEFLEAELPRLGESGITLVSLRDIVTNPAVVAYSK